MEIRRQAHWVYRCMYHMVWIPRYRYEGLVKGDDEYLLKKMDEIHKNYPEIEYVQKKYPAGSRSSGVELSTEVQHSQGGSDNKVEYWEGDVGEV